MQKEEVSEMGKPFLVASFVGGLFGLASAAMAQSNQAPMEMSQLWDGYQVVSGRLTEDGMVQGCIAAGIREERRGCVKGGWVETVVGQPTKLSLQKALELARAADGHTKPVQVVGVLPHWISSGGRHPSPEIAKTEFLVVFKFVK